MLGKLIPPNLFNSFTNLFETPQTIVFIHRWFAFVSALAVVVLFFSARNKNYPYEIRKGLVWAVGIVALQILLGILTVIANIQIAIALLHQANAILLFGASLFLIHRFRAFDGAS